LLIVALVGAVAFASFARDARPAERTMTQPTAERDRDPTEAAT
jgi:hypothetical protein